jgi:hypothetical protein
MGRSECKKAHRVLTTATAPSERTDAEDLGGYLNPFDTHTWKGLH